MKKLNRYQLSALRDLADERAELKFREASALEYVGDEKRAIVKKASQRFWDEITSILSDQCARARVPASR